MGFISPDFESEFPRLKPESVAPRLCTRLTSSALWVEEEWRFSSRKIKTAEKQLGPFLFPRLLSPRGLQGCQQSCLCTRQQQEDIYGQNRSASLVPSRAGALQRRGEVGGELQAPGRAGGDKLTGALGPSLRADGTSVSCALSQGEEFPVLSGKRMGLLQPPVSDGLPLQWAFLFQTIRGCAASQCWGCAWPEGRRGLVCGQPVG